MDIDKLIEKRKSVRSFKDKKVSFKLILEAIDATLRGPFAGNINNLKFIIIESQETIDKIANFSQQHWMNDASTLIVVCSDDTHLENLYGERGRIYSRQHSGAAIEILLLKLTELNLASCWVGAYTDELVKQLLNIPQHIQIEAIIPVGYEKGRAKRPRKKTLDKVISWETWGNSKKPTYFKEPKV